ncbi:alpha/beta hydrolase [Shimia sagamensis]|uniref:Acetyl esterase/lipase n=1 Tax=Shimia sagamensis TaxID=1566352 RepID=A0ABY1PLJ2_9RHOB|nr:alpha/beta hydrolase [Shimia sagamensis]SMP36650.1 Acetyl esterase/lipase [Shimia sagamensis]
MKHSSVLKIALTTALIAAISVPAFATQSAADLAAEGLPMAARTVPVPIGISPQMQALIESRVVSETMPAAETVEEWLAVQAQLDAANAQAAEMMLAKSGATYSTEEIAGVTIYRVTPAEVKPRWADTVFVHVHGGAFVFNGGKAALNEAVWMAHGLGVEVISVDYRRPPLHPFPAATDDVIAVWNNVIQQYDPAKVAMFGTSAGGNLTLSTLLQLRDAGLPLPGAIMAGTPATDLAEVSDSWLTLKGLDPLGGHDGAIEGTFALYAGDTDAADPRLSPVYGDLDGLPPSILLTGTRDLLLSDTVRMHRVLRDAGVTADLHVYDGQSHGDYIAGYLIDAPETKDAWRELNAFFDLHLN